MPKQVGRKRAGPAPSKSSHRVHRDRPTVVYINWIADQIRESGQPELIADLYHRKIDRDAKFRKLIDISIPVQKRPAGDLAPCPRCGREDWFREGILAWFYELQFCAVIGHCCGGHEAKEEADQDYRRRLERRGNEDALLSGLPQLHLKRIHVERLRPSAEASQKVFRELRTKAPDLHRHFRQIKNRGGQLKLHEEIRTGPKSDYVGPAGFRGRGAGDTREISFGILAGMTAVEQDFSPVKILDEVVRLIERLGTFSDEEAFYAITAMSEGEMADSVALLRAIDRGIEKAETKLADFWTFFTPENIERLNAYGSHPANASPFSATHWVTGDRVAVTFKHQTFCQVTFDASLLD